MLKNRLVKTSQQLDVYNNCRPGGGCLMESHDPTFYTRRKRSLVHYSTKCDCDCDIREHTDCITVHGFTISVDVLQDVQNSPESSVEGFEEFRTVLKISVGKASVCRPRAHAIDSWYGRKHPWPAFC